MTFSPGRNFYALSGKAARLKPTFDSCGYALFLSEAFKSKSPRLIETFTDRLMSGDADALMRADQVETSGQSWTPSECLGRSQAGRLAPTISQVPGAGSCGCADRTGRPKVGCCHPQGGSERESSQMEQVEMNGNCRKWYSSSSQRSRRSCRRLATTIALIQSSSWSSTSFGAVFLLFAVPHDPGARQEAQEGGHALEPIFLCANVAPFLYVLLFRRTSTGGCTASSPCLSGRCFLPGHKTAGEAGNIDLSRIRFLPFVPVQRHLLTDPSDQRERNA